MQDSTAKPFGPARIIALALISLTALGLAYLHFSGGDKTVSVPSGARAGQLTLHACHYATKNGSYRADCGTLVVPENRGNAHSRLIAVPVTRMRKRARAFSREHFHRFTWTDHDRPNLQMTSGN